MQAIREFPLFRTIQPARRMPEEVANDGGAVVVAAVIETEPQPVAAIPPASISVGLAVKPWLPSEFWIEGMATFDEAWEYLRMVGYDYHARLGRTTAGYYVVGVTP